MRKTIRYFIFLLVLFSAIGAISADEDQSITVLSDDMEEFPSTVTDGTGTVVNGFAIEWPFSTAKSFKNYNYGEGRLVSKQEMLSAFPDYYEDLAVARQGAELVNEFAFDTYKKIAGDGENTLYFSPYGVYSALWEFYALWGIETQNDIFSGDTDQLMRKLRKMIYGNIVNKLTKNEENNVFLRLFSRHPAFDRFYRHHPSFDLRTSIDSLPLDPSFDVQGLIDGSNTDALHKIGREFSRMTRYRKSSFNVSNSLSTYEPNSLYTSTFDVSLSLTNSTSLDIQGLNFNLIHLLDLHSNPIVRYDEIALYTQTHEFELIRMRFATLKHSLLLINPINGNAFKSIEREIDIKTVKNLFLNMELENCVFPSIFKGFFNNDGKEMVFDLKSTGIIAGTPLDNFYHKASFLMTARNAHPMPFFELKDPSTRIKLETLPEINKHALLFDHPFLFFVIDDPTGAILIMGRSSGYNLEAEK